MPSSVIYILVQYALTAYVGTLVASLIALAVTYVVRSAVAPKPKTQQPDLSGLLSGRLVTVRQAITHWQVIYGQARVGGALTYAETSSDNSVIHLVITQAAHEVEEIGDIWFNDQVVPLDGDGNATGDYAGYVRVYKSLGNEPYGTQPFPALVADSAGGWTNEHRQDGHAKIYVRLTWNESKFPQGVPNITAVVKGKKVYDPRTGSTVWSDTASLCIADYLCDAEVGLGMDYATEIDLDQLAAAANVDEESVALAGGGTEQRYALNGAFALNEQPRELLTRLQTANAGRLYYIGGRWRIVPGAYVTPTETLTEDDLRGAVHIQPRLSRSELANGIKGVFASPDHQWQPTDYPPMSSSYYVAQDQQEEIWRDLDLTFTTSPSMAQRIAKVELERVRQQIRVEMAGKLSAYRLQPGDTVLLTMSRYGWDAKPFEVVKQRLAMEEDGAGGIVLGCDLVLHETAAAVYDWDADLEEREVDPAPDTQLPDPFTVGVPGTPSVSEALYQTTASAGVKCRLTVTWAASADAFVTEGGYYELDHKASADSAWTRVAPLHAAQALIDDAPTGSRDFRVRAVNTMGVRSAWSATTTKVIAGLAAVPSDVTGFAVQAYSGQAKFTWTKPTANSDLDVIIGGRVLVRWAPATSGAAWEDGSLVNMDGYAADAALAFGPLLTGTYFAKFRDSSGNLSATAAEFVVTEALIGGLTTIDTMDDSGWFAGVKQYMQTTGSPGSLTLEHDGGATNWATLLAFADNWMNQGAQGDWVMGGSYKASTELDIGSAQSARIVSSIESTSYLIGDMIDDRTEPIDSWDSIDGAVVEDAEVLLMVRVTTDDPTGAPTWGPWHPLGHVGDYYFWGAQVRLDFASRSVLHNRGTTGLVALARQ